MLFPLVDGEMLTLQTHHRRPNCQPVMLVLVVIHLACIVLRVHSSSCRLSPSGFVPCVHGIYQRGNIYCHYSTRRIRDLPEHGPVDVSSLLD
jgi:hypothetical protein